MKVNPTVALTFVLLSLMFGAGMVSASWGFALGREALKGITQPDVSPTNNLGNRKTKATAGREQMTILREQDIIKKVKNQTQGKSEETPKNQNKSEAQTEEQSAKPAQTDKTTAQAESQFPLSSQDGGVTIAVNSTTTSDDALLLNVSLKNEGGKPVRFLYSFLDVTDDRGRLLSATTDGLPGEIPPNGESFSGTLRISKAILEKAQKLSLKLTDYPEQQLKLQLSGIPIGM